MKRKTVALFMVTLMMGCFSSSKDAVIQTDLAKVSSDIQFLAERLNKVEARLKKVSDDHEKIEKLSSQSRADQSVLIEDLKIENKTLQGSLEVLKHELEQAVTENQKIKEDFDFRIGELEKKTFDATTRSLPSSDPKETPGGSDTEKYKAMMDLYSKKSYAKSATLFKAFAKDNPKSKLAGNAQFWAAESYFAQKQYAQAIKEYQGLVEKHPNHEKACDAIYRQGQAFKSLGKKDSAKLFFGEAVDQCKNPDVKRKAQKELQQLGSKK